MKVLLELLRRHRAGQPVGIYSVCSAPRWCCAPPCNTRTISAATH